MHLGRDLSSRSRSRSSARSDPAETTCYQTHFRNCNRDELWWTHNDFTDEVVDGVVDPINISSIAAGERGQLKFGLVARWNCSDVDIMDDHKFNLQDKQNASDRLQTLHPTRRDGRCSFDEKQHVYTIDGQHVAPWSVSQCCHLCSTGFDAERILSEFYSEEWAIDKNYVDEKGTPLSPIQIKQWWSQNGACQSRRGTLMHWHIECFLNGYLIEGPHSPEFQMFLAFRRDFMDFLNLRPWRTEMNMFHCGLRLAGQADCICINSRGEYVILDWKRCRKIDNEGFQGKMQKHPLEFLPDCNFILYSLQLNLYRRILESEYQYDGRSITVSGMYLVVLHPDQIPSGPHVYEVQRMDDAIDRVSAFVAAEAGVSTAPLPEWNAVFDVTAALQHFGVKI